MEKPRPEGFNEELAPETTKPRAEFLKDEEVGLKAFKEARKPWENTPVPLSDKREKEIARDLRPSNLDSWSLSDKQAYLESLGRLLPELSMCYHQQLSQWEMRMLGECRRLDSQLSDGRADAVEILLRTAAIFSASERDSNTSGSSEPIYQDLVTKAVQEYETAEDTEAVEALTNPYHLEPGTEVIRLDGKNTDFSVETIQDVASGKDGVLAIGDDFYDLNQFNGELARGNVMLKDGDNYFGGLEKLRQEAGVFEAGQTVSFHHVMAPDEITKLEIVGSNKAELEAKYGEAYLPVFRSLLTIDTKVPDGSIKKGIRLDQTGWILEAEPSDS